MWRRDSGILNHSITLKKGVSQRPIYFCNPSIQACRIRWLCFPVGCNHPAKRAIIKQYSCVADVVIKAPNLLVDRLNAFPAFPPIVCARMFPQTNESREKIKWHMNFMTFLRFFFNYTIRSALE